MTKTLEVSIETKILTKAKEEIEKYGWIQNAHGDRRRGYCVIGALEAADPDWVDYDKHARALFSGVIPSGVTEDKESRILVWNDKPGRTKEDVLAAFDTAIAQSMDVGLP